MLADINGYYVDHHHDDRYIPRSEMQTVLPIAVSVADTNVTEPPVNTYGVIASVTVEAPVAGLIQINGGILVATGAVAPSTFSCRLTIGAGVTSSASNEDLDDTDRSSTIAGTSTNGHCQTSGATAVPAGTHVINLVARTDQDASVMDDATLDALFVPGESNTLTVL